MSKSDKDWWGSSIAPLWMRINVTFFAWIFILVISFIVYTDVKNKTTIELIRILGALSILYLGALSLSKIFVFDKLIEIPKINDKKFCLNCGKNDSVLVGKVIGWWSTGKGFRFQRWNLVWHCHSCGNDDFETIRDNIQRSWFIFSIMIYGIIIWVSISSLIIALF